MTLKRRLKRGNLREGDWSRVLKTSRPSIVELALAHPDAPEEVRKKFALWWVGSVRDESYPVLEGELSEEMQVYLFGKLKYAGRYDPAARVFFSNPSLNVRLLRRLLIEMMLESTQYRIPPSVLSVAASPLVARGLGDTVLELVRGKDELLRVTAIVAANPYTPTELLVKMFHQFKNSSLDGSGLVRESLFLNLNLPVETYREFRFNSITPKARERVLEGLSGRMRAKALEAGVGGTVGDVLEAAGKIDSAKEPLPQSFRKEAKLSFSVSDAAAIKARFDTADRSITALTTSVPTGVREDIEDALEKFEEVFLDQLELYRNVSAMRPSESTRRAARAARAQTVSIVEELERLADSVAGLSVANSQDVTESLERIRFRADAYQELLGYEPAGRV